MLTPRRPCLFPHAWRCRAALCVPRRLVPRAHGRDAAPPPECCYDALGDLLAASTPRCRHHIWTLEEEGRRCRFCRREAATPPLSRSAPHAEASAVGLHAGPSPRRHTPTQPGRSPSPPARSPWQWPTVPLLCHSLPPQESSASPWRPFCGCMAQQAAVAARDRGGVVRSFSRLRALSSSGLTRRTSLSREAVASRSAARRHSATSCRAPPPPGRRIIEHCILGMTAHSTGSTGTPTVAAAAAMLPAGLLPLLRRVQLLHMTSTGTVHARTLPASTLTTGPRLHRASRPGGPLAATVAQAGGTPTSPSASWSTRRPHRHHHHHHVGAAARKTAARQAAARWPAAVPTRRPRRESAPKVCSWPRTSSAASSASLGSRSSCFSSSRASQEGPSRSPPEPAHPTSM